MINQSVDAICGFGDSKEKTSIRKFLESIKLEGHIPFRPILFLYYIFRYIDENPNEVDNLSNYKIFLLNLVQRYNVLSFKNNPIFTSKIKKHFEAAIELSLEEKDCKILVTHYQEVLKNIESKMSIAIVGSHRKIDTKTLFPKQK